MSKEAPSEEHLIIHGGAGKVIQTLGHLFPCRSPAVKPSLMVAAISS